MDPAEVRRRNFVPRFTDRYTTGIGTVYDVGDYPEALERVLAAAGYDDLRAEQARRRAANDPIALGIGIAVYVEITAGAPGQRVRRRRAARRRAAARAQRRDAVRAGPRHHVGDGGVRAHGRADRATSRSSTATPTRCASGGLTVGSRSVQIGGAAIATATAKLVDLARERAADLLEAAVDDVVLDDERGRFHVAGTPARTVDWSAIAACRTATTLAAESDFTPVMPTFPFGAHLAVVEVDTETGHARLTPTRRAWTTRASSSTRCSPRARCTAASRRASRRRCSRPCAIRRRRPAADHQLRRLPRDLGGRAAVVRGRAHGDADVREPARAPRASASRARSARSPPSTTRSSTRCRTSASATSRRRSRQSGSGRRSTGRHTPGAADATLGYARTHNDHGGDRRVDCNRPPGRRRAPASAISC